MILTTSKQEWLNIANEEVYYKTDLVKYYNLNIFSEIFRKIDQERLVENIILYIN